MTGAFNPVPAGLDIPPKLDFRHARQGVANVYSDVLRQRPPRL